MQISEYLRAFLIARTAWSKINSLLIVAGAFGVFKKDAVVEVGGYDTETVGEDMEITTRLHRHRLEKRKRWKVSFVPDAVCWTQGPETIQGLRNQRRRWFQGMIETLWKHKEMFLKPKYGGVGSFAFLYFLLVEIIGPIIGLLGIVAFPLSVLLGIISIPYALLFLTIVMLYNLFITIASLQLEKYYFNRYPSMKILSLAFFSLFLENFVFKPQVSWWKLKTLLTMSKQKNVWHSVERTVYK